jgi:hypothetical protein
MKKCLVFTTINIPYLINDYIKNFKIFGHKPEDVEIIIIGDLKTPIEIVPFVEDINKLGFSVKYFDIPSQEKWLEKFPDFKKIIPYNSDNRRNIGYLMAVESGADIIILVDDDNYPIESVDFLKEHSVVGKIIDFNAISDESKWFNVCSMIKFNPERKVYPRGYPYSKRFKDGKISKVEKTGKIIINEGLWTCDPDIDSITRLTEDIKGVEVSSENVVLDMGTFSPINSQNTAFYRDALPCAYFVLMGGNINGLVIERYGDIWFGYFAKKVIDHMNGYVRFGSPVAIHKRNTHNILKDLKQEFWAIQFSEYLVEFIENVKLTTNTYSLCYIELADKLDEFVLENSNFNQEAKEYFKKVVYAMKIWVKTCDLVLNKE